MKKEIFILLIFMSILPSVYSQVDNRIRFNTQSKFIYDICFTESGDSLGIADGNSVKLFSTNSNELLDEFKNGHNDKILTIDISKDKSLLVSGGKDSTIVIWDFINNKILKTLTFQKGIITSIKLSPDGRYLASGGTNNKVFVYDLYENEIVHEFYNHTDDVVSVKFSQDGTLLATASCDNTINIYNLKNNKSATLSGHKKCVRGISFYSDSKSLLSCGDDGQVITWNISNLDRPRINKVTKHRFSWLLCIDLYQDLATYAVGDVNGNAEIVGRFGSYKAKIKVPINKILIKPMKGTKLKIVIATRGKGVMLIDTRNMKYKSR